MIIVAFGLTAAAGTLLRWQAAASLGRAAGTAAVNLVGSFLLGIAIGADGTAATVIHVAALGSLTTFSAMVLEIVDVYDEAPSRAWAYAATSIIGGVTAAWLGLQLA
ncbi:MAG: CrcB protein [Candidatus Aldehydirespiratoraceae bacterium]